VGLTLNVFFVPVFVFLAVAIALSVGLWLSALNVQYRDVRHAIPFITQFWFFVTPVVYPSSLVPERWHAIQGLNPLVGVVDGLRWALLGSPEPSAVSLILSMTTTAVLLIGGVHYFRRMEKNFADLV
jgi:lipopolysaccharide transport system permease protein